MRKSYRTARPNPRLLEPRMVFDAAAAAVVTELATDTAHVVDLTRTIDATESLLTQQSESLPTAAMRAQIAFVDAALLKDGTLPGLNAGVELVALQPDTDGIAQISAALAGRSDVSAIYLVTHGGPGRVSLGATELDNSTLAANAARIAEWAPHLSAGADILLYGCQVGGADGLALLQSLANLTGADVAASTNNTGPAALGGDWVLEQSTGTIEAQGFATPDGLARLDALLSVNVSSNSLTGWVAVTAANNQNDATNDQQTGSGSVSQDIVGNTTYRSAYVKYDDGGTANDLSDDWLAFRVRVNNQDNNNPATPRFTGFAFFGVDADGNGSVDFFAGVYNPAGNNGRIGVYDANGAGNTGPSDTGINGTPTFKYDSATTGYAGLYSMLATGDGSNFSGDIDYFVSYQIRIADLNASKAVFGLTADVTQNTVLRYIVGTAAQDNAFNQDISGITGAYMSSNLTWAQLGGFTSPIQTNGAVVTSASADTATADERGGTANGSGGSTPTGNLLTNDAGSGITLTRVQAGATVGVSAGTVTAGSTSTLNATTVQGTYGTLTLGADGSYSYAVDNANATVQALRTSSSTLTDTFSYRITDASAGTADSTLTVTIRGANDAPVITSGANGSVAENASISTVVYTGTATDVDTGDTKTWSLKSGVGDESLLAINATTGAVTLRAPANYESKASYSFTIVVTDAGGLTSEQGVTVAITNVNEAPVAVVDTGAATERGGVANGTAGSDATGNVLTNDTDPDAGDTRSVTAFSRAAASGTVGQALAGSYGSLTLNADGSYSYVIDNANASVQALRTNANTLTETFSYTITDSGGLTSSSTLTITIRGANDAPVITSGNSGSITENAAVSTVIYTGTATDVDAADTKAWSLKPGIGDESLLTINGTTGAVTLRTAADHESKASYSFTIIVTDAGGLTSEQAVTVAVIDVNEAPTALPDTGIADERGGTANGTAGTDAGGNVLANDTDPDTADTLSVTAIGRTGASGTVGQAFAGTYGSLTLNADGSYSYAIDNANASVQALRTSSNTLTETFTYTITDSGGLTSSSTLTITIRGANDAPVITSGNSGSMAENAVPSTVIYTGTATDVDAGDTKAWSLKPGVGDEALLSINASTGAVTLRTPADYESQSSYTFTIVVTDAAGLTTEQAVTVAVLNVNEAPLAAADSADATERGGVANGTAGSDATGNVLGNDTDPDNPDSASVTAITFGGTSATVGQPLQGTYGTLTLNADGSFSYVIDDTHGAVQSLNSGDTLTETFAYTMTDAGGLSSSSTITITIHGANDAPVASVVPAVTVAEGVPMSPIVVPAFTDVDNFVVVYSAALPDGSPLPGWIGFNPLTRTFTGTPPAGNPGTITIRVTGTDGSLSDSVDISLVVSAPQAPQAADDAASATEAGGVANGTPGSDSSGNLLGNDSGLQIAVSRAQAGTSLGAGAASLGSGGAIITGSHGQLTVQADGSYVYVLSQTDAAVQSLNVGQSLTDVFSYEVTDSTGQTSVALLTVTIDGANDAPLAVALPAVSLTTGSPITPLVLPSFTDVDNTVLTYSATLPDGSPLPGWLSFDPATRAFTGTPPTGSPGTLTLRMTGTDGSLAAHADFQLVIGDPPPAPAPVQAPPPVPLPSVLPVAPLPSGTVAITPPADAAPRAPEPLPITRSTTAVPPVNEALAPARPAFELSGSALATPYELARLQPVPEPAPMGDLYSDSRGFRVLVMPSNVQELSVFRGISDQFVERGSNVKFNLPQDAFVHARPDQIVRLSARQADGRPLPLWLQFDAENGSFTGTPPQDFEGEVRISILARDGAGNEAAALFRLNVEEPGAGDARGDSLSSRLREALPFSPPAAPLPELPSDDAATAEPATGTPAEAGQAG